MSFDLSHWKNPRKTIATRFEHDDMAYATHGAMMAMEALVYLNPELKGLTLLDYGCGTGRVARVLSRLFTVYAYDPVPECIELAKKECSSMNFPNLHYFTDIEAVPEVDLAVCINVIEHLNEIDANLLINNLTKKVRGNSFLWYSTTKNKAVMYKYLSEEQRVEDDASPGITIRPFAFRSI